MSADFQICISVPLKLKNNFKKVNLNDSNPLVHLHIQSHSLTNSVLKFKNIETSIFKQQLSRIPVNYFFLFL